MYSVLSVGTELDYHVEITIGVRFSCLEMGKLCMYFKVRSFNLVPFVLVPDA